MPNSPDCYLAGPAPRPARDRRPARRAASSAAAPASAAPSWTAAAPPRRRPPTAPTGRGSPPPPPPTAPRPRRPRPAPRRPRPRPCPPTSRPTGSSRRRTGSRSGGCRRDAMSNVKAKMTNTAPLTDVCNSIEETTCIHTYNKIHTTHEGRPCRYVEWKKD